MSKDFLALRSVEKTYNPGSKKAVRAVRDFSLEIAKGEIVALLGSSGCGKTSTLRMIAGFEAVSAGEIALAGKPIHRLPPARRGVAMAFEGYSLYPPLTVRENIGFALRSRGLDAGEVARRVDEVAALVEIEDALDRYPSSISGGQQQRASLARALIREADLHLLDEPMGQLEPQLRAILRGRIKHFVKERGLTVILVTHDQTEANALADRIAVMEGGLLQQFDRPEVIRAAPANLFTGAFIGEPPMNVFPAEVSADAGDIVFGLGGGVALRYPEVELSGDLKSRLIADRRATIGVRPHAVQVGDGGAGAGAVAGAVAGAGAEVFANQWLGDQSHIAAHFAEGAIVSVAHDRSRLARGDRIGVSIAVRDLHIFDAETGAAISHGGRMA